MPIFQIVEARLHHCGRMVRALRHEHGMAFARLGINSHRELRQTVALSTFRRSLLIDGELGGMWGYVGPLLSPYAFVWLAFSQHATRYPIFLVKETRRQLDEMMASKEELTTAVLDGDETALRFAAFLGFHVSHDDPMGAPATSRWSRRNLVRHAKETPDFRVPLGRSFAIRMGYHPEAS